jgi:ABC-2 type transport system permease protein
VLAVIVLNLVDLVLLGVILRTFHALGDWTIWQIVFLYCLYLTAMGIQNLFTLHLGNIQEFVQDGTLDQMLTRPVSPLIQLLGKEISYKDLTHIVLGLAGLVMSSAELRLAWSPAKVLLCCCAVLGGALVLAGIVLGLCSLAFWTVQSKVFLYGTLQVQEVVQHYPSHIFGRWFLSVVTLALPFAFINYYPTALILGASTGGAPRVLGYLTPAAGVAVLWGGTSVWAAGLRRYQSAGG